MLLIIATMFSIQVFVVDQYLKVEPRKSIPARTAAKNKFQAEESEQFY